MTTQERKIPAPDPNPETQHYWQAVERGELLTRKCTACSQLHFYPRAMCPDCGAPDTEWVRLSGEGEIYSYSIMRAAPVPYIIAYVRLREGVTMLTNIVDCAFDKVKVGMPVRVTFRTHEGGGRIPMFSPLG